MNAEREALFVRLLVDHYPSGLVWEVRDRSVVVHWQGATHTIGAIDDLSSFSAERFERLLGVWFDEMVL